MNQCEIVVTNFEVRVAVSALIFFSELGRAVVRDRGPGQLWWCVGIVGNFLGHCGQLSWALWATLVGIVEKLEPWVANLASSIPM